MLIEQISKDFMAAYKAKEMEKKDFLGVLKTEVTKETKTPEDTYVVGKIKSMIKNAAATNSLSESELEILNQYLPAQMSESDLRSEIELIINTNSYDGMKDMGKVMGMLSGKLAGKADGKMIANTVKALLMN